MVELKNVVKHIEELAPMVNSVMATGGEPLLQSKACLALVKWVRKFGLECGIRTNGTNPKGLERVSPYLNFIAIDVGAPFADAELYGKVVGRPVTGGFLQKIKESLRIAIGSDAEVEARTTIVPTLNDRRDIIEEIALDVIGVDCLRLQQFRNVGILDPNFRELPVPSRKNLIKLARAAKKEGIGKVRIFTLEGGLEEV
jgi:pyruvate formate lyase activating enzyme